MKTYAAIVLLAATALTAVAQSAAPGQAQPKKRPDARTSRVSPIEAVKRYLEKLGKPIDPARSKNDIVVSSFENDKKGRVDIVIAYDQKKDLLGFYIYNFGNMKSAVDPASVRTYLLSANDQITIGGFFIDSDRDIGYKYLAATEQLSLAAFESIYVTMAMVALDRRPAIQKLLKQGRVDDNQAQRARRVHKG